MLVLIFAALLDTFNRPQPPPSPRQTLFSLAASFSQRAWLSAPLVPVFLTTRARYPFIHDPFEETRRKTKRGVSRHDNTSASASIWEELYRIRYPRGPSVVWNMSIPLPYDEGGIPEDKTGDTSERGSSAEIDRKLHLEQRKRLVTMQSMLHHRVRNTLHTLQQLSEPGKELLSLKLQLQSPSSSPRGAVSALKQFGIREERWTRSARELHDAVEAVEEMMRIYVLMERARGEMEWMAAKRWYSRESAGLGMMREKWVGSRSVIDGKLMGAEWASMDENGEEVSYGEMARQVDAIRDGLEEVGV